jgi:hypothetical protein
VLANQAIQLPLTAASSKTASTTTSLPATESSSADQLSRSHSASASCCSILPPLSARATDCSICARERSSAGTAESTSVTVSPARAADSATPEPMNPAPTTPTSNDCTGTPLDRLARG